MAKEKPFIAVGAVILLLIYVYSLIIPNVNAISYQKSLVEEKNDIIASLTSVPQPREELLHKELERLQLLEKDVQRRIPAYISISDIILELKDFNDTGGGIIEDLQFVWGSDKSQGSYYTQPINIFWQGSFDQIILFLHQIEISLRKYSINSITISNSRAAYSDQLKANISLNTYALANSQVIFKNPGDVFSDMDMKINIFSSQDYWSNIESQGEEGDMKESKDIKKIIDGFLGGD